MTIAIDIIGIVIHLMQVTKTEYSFIIKNKAIVLPVSKTYSSQVNVDEVISLPVGFILRLSIQFSSITLQAEMAS